MFLKVVKIALYVMLTQCSLCNANVEVNSKYCDGLTLAPINCYEGKVAFAHSPHLSCKYRTFCTEARVAKMVSISSISSFPVWYLLRLVGWQYINIHLVLVLVPDLNLDTDTRHMMTHDDT